MTRLTVIAGPTAVGKGTVVREMLRMRPDILVSVSATTRSPRPGEINGQHYLFVSDEEFDDLIENGELLEYATVHQKHRYGTPSQPVMEALANNKQVILEIDIQGARQVKTFMPSANLVFIAPPSLEELENRLAKRGTESAEEVAIRLRTAEVELQSQEVFDHVVINADVSECAQQVLDLMESA
jgi:guanylate kinase